MTTSKSHSKVFYKHWLYELIATRVGFSAQSQLAASHSTEKKQTGLFCGGGRGLAKGSAFMTELLRSSDSLIVYYLNAQIVLDNKCLVNPNMHWSNQ